MNNQKERIQLLNKLVEHYGFQHWWESKDPLEDCMSMILIQRTTEENAKRALENLKPYLQADILAAIAIEKLQKLIYPAGFYRQKSQYIKEFIAWFQQNGSEFQQFEQWPTERLREELLKVKGIGSETVDVMLLYIFDRNVFIADVYAQRLFARLGFGEYANYEEMRQDFIQLAEVVPLVMCKEWHAAINVHGKAYRKTKNLDETWLLTKTI